MRKGKDLFCCPPFWEFTGGHQPPLFLYVMLLKIPCPFNITARFVTPWVFMNEDIVISCFSRLKHSFNLKVIQICLQDWMQTHSLLLRPISPHNNLLKHLKNYLSLLRIKPWNQRKTCIHIIWYPCTCNLKQASFLQKYSFIFSSSLFLSFLSLMLFLSFLSLPLFPLFCRLSTLFLFRVSLKWYTFHEL